MFLTDSKHDLILPGKKRKLSFEPKELFSMSFFICMSVVMDESHNPVVTQ